MGEIEDFIQPDQQDYKEEGQTLEEDYKTEKMLFAGDFHKDLLCREALVDGFDSHRYNLYNNTGLQRLHRMFAEVEGDGGLSVRSDERFWKVLYAERKKPLTV